MYTNPLDSTAQSLSTWNEAHSLERPERRVEKLSLTNNNEAQDRTQEVRVRAMPPAQAASMERLKGRATIGAHRTQSMPNWFNL